jgi:hypothetical protein
VHSFDGIKKLFQLTDFGDRGPTGLNAVLPVDPELEIDPEPVKDQCMVDSTVKELVVKIRAAMHQNSAQVWP